MQTELRQIRFHRPNVATKQLKVQTVQDKRRVTLSSNFLLLMGFKAQVSQTVEESLGSGKGFTVRLATPAEIEEGNTKSVYLREYSSRSANPLKRKEHLVQVSRKDLIDDALGVNCKHVHVTMRFGLLTFRPINETEYLLMQDLSNDQAINTLVGLTGGVDCHVLEEAGFKISAALELRPNEARDKADYTELTSLSVLANSKPDFLFNEDIYKLDLEKFGEVMANANITVCHFSFQCDDFSPLKTDEQKKKSLVDLSSTIDMFMPGLAILDKVKSPVLVVENVKGFVNNPIFDVLKLQLMRRGFTVHHDVFDARDYGGYTSRERAYIVATALQAPFSFPEKTAPAGAVWDAVIEHYWDEIAAMEVTDTKVVQDSIKFKRIRSITQSKYHAPTLTRAQGQDTKDAVVVERDGRYFRLPVSVQKALNSISQSFNVDWMPKDKAAQVIGQSICQKLHHAIMCSVKQHILLASANGECRAC